MTNRFHQLNARAAELGLRVEKVRGSDDPGAKAFAIGPAGTLDIIAFHPDLDAIDTTLHVVAQAIKGKPAPQEDHGRRVSPMREKV